MYWPADASQRIVLPWSAELTDVTVSFATLSPVPEYMSVIFGTRLPLPQLGISLTGMTPRPALKTLEPSLSTG